MHLDRGEEREREEEEDERVSLVPDTGDADQGFIEVGIGVNAVCGIEHSLTCTMVLGLSDESAVTIEGGDVCQSATEE